MILRVTGPSSYTDTQGNICIGAIYYCNFATERKKLIHKQVFIEQLLWAKRY